MAPEARAGRHDSAMTGSQTFYQVAIALIPALLFGGALARRRSALGPAGRFAGTGVAVALLAGVAAQLIAIRGAIDPSISRFETRYLVFVVVVATVGLALWTAVPWVAPPRRSSWRAAGWRRWGSIALGLSVIVAGLIGAQLAITESLDHAEARIAFVDASEEFQRARDAYNKADSDVLAARAELLSVVSDAAPNARRRLAPVIARHLEAVDDAVSPVTRENLSGPPRTQQLVKGRLDAAFARLNDVTGELHQALDAGEPRIPEWQRLLVQLALRRLSSVEASRLVSVVNDLGAAEAFREACNDAPPPFRC